MIPLLHKKKKNLHKTKTQISKTKTPDGNHKNKNDLFSNTSTK